MFLINGVVEIGEAHLIFRLLAEVNGPWLAAGVVSSGPELVIRGAWSCDLDKGVEVKPNGYEDFSWIIKSTGVDQFAVPTNKALFGIY